MNPPALLATTVGALIAAAVLVLIDRTASEPTVSFAGPHTGGAPARFVKVASSGMPELLDILQAHPPSDPEERTLPVPEPEKNPEPSPATGLPLPHTMTSERYQALLYKFLDNRDYRASGWAVDKGVRDTGPFINGQSYGTHEAARIWYSPDVIEWMEAGRTGGIPDGAIIVKEMYKAPAIRSAGLDQKQLDSALTGWAVMVRDSTASQDGWYWSFYSPGQAVDDPDKYPYDYPNSLFGAYCVRCHASAESHFTFASLTNVEGYPGDPITFRVDDSWMPNGGRPVAGLASHPVLAAASSPGKADVGPSDDARTLNADFVELFDQIAVIPAHDVLKLPSVSWDHVWAGADGPEQFLTSDQCLGCHDGNGLPFGPNMYIPASDGKNINLSPYGEWNWSMMGLAGRDPIFYSQLESEITLYPARAAETQNLCFSCHGVMGQRQLTIDHPGSLFNVDIPYVKAQSDPMHKYGALARDGISCTVCHQIVDDGLPLDSIYTGRFHVSAPGEFEKGVSYIYGPFEKPKTLAMHSSLGMKPVQNTYVKGSRLCGSCHSVHLPVYDSHGKEIKSGFEQATYLEWQNSAYQNEFGDGGKTPKTCQNCHMPDQYPFTDSGAHLAFRIANIQDATYPEADERAPLDSITLEVRKEFARHMLLGINAFALEMFNQFDDVLGVRKRDYMTYSTNGLPFAIENAGRLAREHTADVEIVKVEANGDRLKATVKVTNKTGHRFPSGVGFRRAFLEFQVIDDMNTVVWASGRTNSLGVIVDGQGQPLRSEFFDPDPRTGEQSWQPHYRTITREDQAQIYQELVKNSDGKFTTSFLAIDKHVKDNRLLPLGWTTKGPSGMVYVEATHPHGEAAKDPDFTDGSGSDVIVYEIDLPPGVAAGATVTARLYYQSIPPYYLRDRFTIAPTLAGTRRLHYLTSHLRTEGTLIENWKLFVGGDREEVRS